MKSFFLKTYHKRCLKNVYKLLGCSRGIRQGQTGSNVYYYSTPFVVNTECRLNYIYRKWKSSRDGQSFDIDDSKRSILQPYKTTGSRCIAFISGSCILLSLHSIRLQLFLSVYKLYTASSKSIDAA